MDTQNLPSPRLRRYARDPQRKPPLVLQPRDITIVRTVAAHRLVSSEELTLLVGGSSQGLLRRLQALFHHGFLDRPRAQRSLAQNAPMLYALGQRGVDYIARASGRRPVVIGDGNRDLHAPFLEHALMVSRFKTTIKLAVRASNGVLALGQWLPDGAVRDAVIVTSGEISCRIPIAPDAVFTIHLAKEPEGQNRVRVVLEADRSTMEVKRFITKLRGYFTYWQQGHCEKQIGAKEFLVATVTKSADRAAHLRDACRRQLGERDTRMFVFADEAKYLPLDSGRIVEPIWQTPADGELHALTE